MNAEFFAALALIEKEKGIPKEKMLERINQALLAAIRKDNPGAEENVFVDVDEAKNKIDMYIRKTVVETVENPAIELLPEEAKRYSKRAQVGDVVNVPVDTKKFGRIAAQSAKGVIIQGIREAERSIRGVHLQGARDSLRHSYPRRQRPRLCKPQHKFERGLHRGRASCRRESSHRGPQGGR